MRADLPTGTVTFLFTDVEGSTKLLDQLGPEGYADALAAHRRIVREAVAAHGGVEVDTQGDAFFVAFPTADGALAAAGAARDGLADGPIRLRMGIHTGTPHLGEEGYVGADVHRAARIAAAGHGGQVLVSTATVALVGTEGLRELGEHRLRDFAQPVALYQLGDQRFPPLRTISNTNLPRPASSFVGREREVDEVAAQLRDGVRLLTLTGPGGSGKTRLALEAAASLVPEFKAGVFWVGLAPLRDAALVTETIAVTLGAKDGLADHIGEREMLLLLDNLEQVVGAAPELATLVEACPHLRLLVTSRERLRVRGEVEYPVLPLADPEAVDLFTERARTEPDASVRQLCQALDNLPLAIELAAARASVLTSVQILERLSGRLDLLKGGRDADPRQATLRATIEWSHDLLTPPEQRLFARLAVFAGGCTLEAAQAVAEADLDTLQSLVDKSLLRHTADRFWMLETIREFAAERLAASGEADAVQTRHAEHFLALAEEAYAERLTLMSRWFPVMEVEHDNIRAVLDWTRVRRPAAALQLLGAVTHFWQLGAHLSEASERTLAALPRHESRDWVRARALTHLGDTPWLVPNLPAYLDEALRLWRELGDGRGEALALEAIGWGHLYAGEYDSARLAFEESLVLRARVGAPKIEGTRALAGLCQLFVASGQIERVEPLAQDLYELGRLHDNLDVQGDGLHYLADCPLIGGDYAEAEKRYARALGNARNAGIVVQCPSELIGVAMSVAGQGDYARAVRLAAAAHAQREALGLRPGNPAHWWIKLQETHIGGARSHLTPEEVEEAERAGRNAPFDAVLDEVLGPGSGGSR
ncbi:MAG TPA: adenylate/guanylate cyclase domain-containing protein [Pleomorphomonadaceae bacterium]|nr:adenylate/guanylate cyclase domain-containing protein [Pleomorphomonadaceae bacterium]